MLTNRTPRGFWKHIFIDESFPFITTTYCYHISHLCYRWHRACVPWHASYVCVVRWCDSLVMFSHDASRVCVFVYFRMDSCEVACQTPFNIGLVTHRPLDTFEPIAWYYYNDELFGFMILRVVHSVWGGNKPGFHFANEPSKTNNDMLFLFLFSGGGISCHWWHLTKAP